MTDVEYFQLSVLFEEKHLTMSDLESLDRWVQEYDTRPAAWATPADLIKILSEYPAKGYPFMR